MNTSQLVLSMAAGALGALVMLVVAGHNPGLIPGIVTTPASVTTTTSPNGTETITTSEESLIVDTVKRVNPAVVSIVITKDVPVVERYFSNNPGNNPFDLFGNGFLTPFNFQVPQVREQGTRRVEVGGGSGFLVSADGMIVTNRHVVADESAEYTVFTNDGEKHTAQVVARDPANDIAILKIEGSGHPFLSFGDSDQLLVGQTAIAIGNALSEFQNTVSVGVISGLSRSITAGDATGRSEQLEQVIQTDAAINPGNSGGPLLNLSGHVIGVNVAVAQGSENIGFALPANAVKSVVESVQQTGKISRPYLGVRYAQITPQIQQNNDLPVDYGVLIVAGETGSEPAVVPGSAAAKAGLKEDDIILEIDGQKLDAETSLASIIRQKKVGDSVRLTVLQNGQQKDLTITLEEIPQ